MIAIERESFSDSLSKEILPLAQKCWEESTVSKGDTCAYYGERDFAVEPDISRYKSLSDEGSMVLITVRDEGELKGYAIGLLYRSMHHKKILCAIGDSIYVEPAYRSYTGVVAEKFERELKEKKVQILGWPVHMKGPVYEVLKASGYVGDDIVMEKRLCA